jgi:hypothetical protein
VLSNKQSVENMYLYLYGTEPNSKIISADKFSQDTLLALIAAKQKIIIDFAHSTEPTSRKTMTINTLQWIESYIGQPFATFEALATKKNMYIINNK